MIEIWPPRQVRYQNLTVENYNDHSEFLQEAEDEYIYRLSRRITKENYVDRSQKKAAVLSCGKNSGCWKTDGRHIPWELRMHRSTSSTGGSPLALSWTR